MAESHASVFGGCKNFVDGLVTRLLEEVSEALGRALRNVSDLSHSVPQRPGGHDAFGVVSVGSCFDSLQLAMHFEDLENGVANLLLLERSNVQASSCVLYKVVRRGLFEPTCFNARSYPRFAPNRSLVEYALCVVQKVLK